MYFVRLKSALLTLRESWPYFPFFYLGSIESGLTNWGKINTKLSWPLSNIIIRQNWIIFLFVALLLLICDTAWSCVKRKRNSCRKGKNLSLKQWKSYSEKRDQKQLMRLVRQSHEPRTSWIQEWLFFAEFGTHIYPSHKRIQDQLIWGWYCDSRGNTFILLFCLKST